MDAEWGERNVVEDVTRVVDTIIGRTAVVYKILKRFGVQVFVRERGYERENWPWRNITVRSPRLVKRWPRPFRWPREEPTKQCHCKIGKMEVENAEESAVRCQRCKQLIGSESYPRRIERASELLRKASAGAKPKREIHKRVQKRTQRKKIRRNKGSLKAGKNSKGGVVLRPTRRSNAKNSNSKTRKRTPLPKRKRRTRKIPQNHALSKVPKKTGKKARTAKRIGK